MNGSKKVTNKIGIRVLACLLAVLLMVTGIGGIGSMTSGISSVSAGSAAVNYKTVLQKTAQAIETTLTSYKEQGTEVTWYGPAYASIGGEWAVIGEARYGLERPIWYRAYYENLIAALKTAFEADDFDGTYKLHKVKSTENSRVILALTAMGLDASDIEGYNLLQPLADLNYVKKQGLNGPVFALLALDSGKYKIPSVGTQSEALQTTREGLVSYILSRELENGGFNLTQDETQGADPDMTAMALQALAPYYKTNAEIGASLQAQVKETVDRGIAVLSSLQNENGTYSSYGAENAESTAQVLVALSSLGLDGDTDIRFQKNGNSVLDGLLRFYISSNGMFQHVKAYDADQMATEQAFYALVSYDRCKTGRQTLYNMTDAKKACMMNLNQCKVSISNSSYTYAGKAVSPKVTVTYQNLAGAEITLKKNQDYTVTYQKNAAPGKATVTVTGKNEYSGTTTKTFQIYPAAVSIKKSENSKSGITIAWKKVKGATGYIVYRKTGTASWKKYKTIKKGSTVSFTDTKTKNGTKYTYQVCAVADGLQGKKSKTTTAYRLSQTSAKASRYGKGKIKVSWKKNSKATGYQIKYSTKASMAGAKTKTVKGVKTISRKLTGLKKGKTYYITVRAYKTVKGKKYYSGWSKCVKVKA